MIELTNADRLNIGSLSDSQISRDYHQFLLEDMTTLFREYRNVQVTKHEEDEIRRRVDYLEFNYHRIVGRTFGIMFKVRSGWLDMLLYPL